MKRIPLTRSALWALLVLASLPVLQCTTSTPKMEAASFQNTELSGTITVVVEGGKKIPRITTADGKIYTITGKLERMVRDFYKGQSLRLAGRIESEPNGATPGVFRVEEIILELH